MRSLKFTLSALAILVAFTALASSASAGAYRVYSCKLPNGQPAATDGWSPVYGVPEGALGNNCATGGSLDGSLSGNVAQPSNTARVSWAFNTGSRDILSWTASVAITNLPAGGNTNSTPGSWISRGQNTWQSPYQFHSCGTTSGCVAESADYSEPIAPINTKSFYVTAMCGGNTSCNYTGPGTNIASFNISKASFVLADNANPTSTTPTGALIDNSTHSGNEGIQFTATDPAGGSGIYKVQYEVDGQIVSTVTPNDNGGKCAPVGSDATYNDFTSLQPCPQTTPVSLEFNTTSVTDGSHSMRIRVLDAAGNSSTVYGPTNFTVKNVPDPKAPTPGDHTQGNGSGGNLTTAQFSSTSAKGNLIRTKYGRKKVLSTRLVDAAGAPIAGAQVDVYEFVNVAGATEHKVTTLQSDGQGWVSYTPRTTANKLVTFKWAKQLGSSSYQAADATTLIVDGSLRMKAKHRKLRSRGKLQLTGKLYGEDMPKSVPVQIQVKRGKTWSVVSIVNTKKNGTFKWNYKFKYTAHGKFTFRALVRKSSDLSVEASRSKAVKVKVV